MKVFYYKDPHGNFGDDLNAWLWEAVAPGIWDEYDNLTVVGIGTILGERQLPPASSWIVMSSGAGYAPAPRTFGAGHWNILCVRGPLTAMVLDLPAEKAVTDGAILLSLLPEYQPAEASARHGVVFMPHHSQMNKSGRWREACAQAGIEFLDPRDDSKMLVERIRHAELVLADAMHAAIVADTLRVPWIPITLSPQTHSFKWLDWTLSLHLPYKPVSLQASSFMESMERKASTIAGENNVIEDLTVENAKRYFTRLSKVQPGTSKSPIRPALKKAFRAFKKISSFALTRKMLSRLDRVYLKDAVKSLLAVKSQSPFLSDEITFTRRKNEMKQHLETLKSLGSSSKDAYKKKVLTQILE